MTTTARSRHLGWHALAAGLVVGLVTIGASLANAEASTSTPADVQTIVVRDVGDKTLSVAIHHNNTGTLNEIILSGRLFQGTTQVGHVNAVCIDTLNGQDTCNGDYVFDGQGTLTVQGLFDFGNPTEAAAITGGTGAFRGARGEIDAVSVNDNTVQETFHLVG